jgi:2-amino-4-hydroxy-6-hydroxymethyldihydropteridine diphosphokinase
MTQEAVIALGANLGDRAATLSEAARQLASLGRVRARSSLWQTAPLGPPQPDYLNAAALVETALPPLEVLEGLLTIERAFGRERRERWGPRTIDLDLVALGSVQLASERLILPHPEASRRAFVLAPIAEVAPDLVLPGFGRVVELLAALPESARAGVRSTRLAW